MDSPAAAAPSPFQCPILPATFTAGEPNPLRNEGSVFQDSDRVILDEARMHVNTYTKHLKS
jgi:hypothetical protein